MQEMNDELWAGLAAVANGITIDMRYKNDKEEIRRYDTLVRYKYATCSETGPGDSILIYNITPAGKAALDAHKNQ